MQPPSNLKHRGFEEIGITRTRGMGGAGTTTTVAALGGSTGGSGTAWFLTLCLLSDAHARTTWPLSNLTPHSKARHEGLLRRHTA